MLFPYSRPASQKARANLDIERFITIVNDENPMMNLELVAKDEKVFDYWCDALNHLLGREMNSSNKESEFEYFLTEEVNMRLLEIDDIIDELPDTAPPIPELPDLTGLDIGHCDDALKCPICMLADKNPTPSIISSCKHIIAVDQFTGRETSVPVKRRSITK